MATVAEKALKKLRKALVLEDSAGYTSRAFGRTWHALQRASRVAGPGTAGHVQTYTEREIAKRHGRFSPPSNWRRKS